MQRSYHSNEQSYSTNDNQKKKCVCGLVATVKVSRKENENKGRQFLTCPKAGKSCGFFEWIDEDSGNVSRIPSTSTGPSSTFSCYKCGVTGHFANACTS